MQDNYEVSAVIQAEETWVDEAPSPCNMMFDETDPCFVEWQETQSGPYTSRAGSFTMISRSGVSWNADSDLLYLSSPGYGGVGGFYPGYSNITLDPYSWGTPIVKMQTGNPSGTVRLRSTDPREAPAINFNYFAENEDHDLQAIVDGMEYMFRAFDQTGIPYRVTNPNPEFDIRQGIKDSAFSHHATSSCRMGPAGHEDYCVDSKFRVHGVDSLRIVDASVLPRAPGGMPNGPTFTLSRKAFEMFMEGSEM